ENLDEFLKDCYKHNINYLVLNFRFGELFEELSEIYSEELEIDEITKIGEVKDFKIFKIEPEQIGALH
ncbi:MAG TPA: hypothetical protein VLN45_06300, partial [Ignavibacteriaceae bacterium]|nr:hypothetical protein [Ignavibacteriaceae bacterium]